MLDLQSIVFEDDALGWNEALGLTFTAVRDTRLGYRLVFRRNGSWDLEDPVSFWDAGEEDELQLLPGMLDAGYHERSILLEEDGEEDEGVDSSGYVLLQLITTDGESSRVVCSHVLCVPAEEGDPALSVTVPEGFCPAEGGELTFFVGHALPCALTVTIEAEDGTVARRLAASQATRPGLAHGSSFTWNGRLGDGTLAPAGRYRLRVTTRVGGERYETVSELFELLSE